MKNLLILTSFIFLSAFSCQNGEKISPLSDEIITLKSGQSFGMCIGNCYAELIIDSENITFKQIIRPERAGEQEKVIENIDNENKALLKAKIDKTSKSDFLALDEFYGCPDCADGGAEWLEIEFKDGKSKRVNFEYGDNLRGFEDLIKTLREERLLLKEKYK